jgi:hypothetical protein
MVAIETAMRQRFYDVMSSAHPGLMFDLQVNEALKSSNDAMKAPWAEYRNQKIFTRRRDLGGITKCWVQEGQLLIRVFDMPDTGDSAGAGYYDTILNNYAGLELDNVLYLRSNSPFEGMRGKYYQRNFAIPYQFEFTT